MTEEKDEIRAAYRRAGYGLGIAAIGWTLAMLFAKGQKEMTHWLIPIFAAAISVLCFSRYQKLKESQE